MKRIARVGAALMIMTTAGFAAGPAHALISADGKIAYVSDQNGHAEIWVMDAPGGANPHRLTTTPTYDVQPVWSPDGTRIAFVRKDSAASGSATQIWLMNADGTGQHPITHDAVVDEDPAWSPDGTRIAYTRGEGSAARVWVTNLATGSATNLSPSYETREPSWRPDGSSLVVSTRDLAASTNYRLTSIPSGGGAGQPFAAVSGSDMRHPAWSPDGQYVAAEVVTVTPSPYSVSTSIVVKPAAEVAAPHGISDASEPAWSPDSSTLMFARMMSGRLQIFSRSLGSTEIVGLSPYGGANEYQPSWQRLPRIVCPRPVLKGTARVGKRLSVVQGRLSPALTKVRFTWLRGAKSIKGATGRSYRLTRKDAGKAIRVQATCSVVGANAPVVTVSAQRKVRR